MKSSKKALITGVTGQDGSYLSELLLDKGYEVHGVKRMSSSFNTARIEHIYNDPHNIKQPFYLHYGDLTDGTSLLRLLKQIEPTEIYNLAAQSHVGVSFQTPEYTANADALGTLRLLEAIRILNMKDHVRYYQASTSELFGGVQKEPQSELTPFNPRSPYAVAKLYSYYITINYRQGYNMHASNGILFNHESPRRGETFVTRKITRAATRILLGLQDKLYLGNLDAVRDWGHAKDYVEAMWIMLQQDKPDDFVIATGNNYSVREFCNSVFAELGIHIIWQGEDEEEFAVIDRLEVESTDFLYEGKTIVEVDPLYFRPTEVDTLTGDARKAEKLLKWKPKINLEMLIKEMVESDLKLAQIESNENLSFTK